MKKERWCCRTARWVKSVGFHALEWGGYIVLIMVITGGLLSFSDHMSNWYSVISPDLHYCVIHEGDVVITTTAYSEELTSLKPFDGIVKRIYHVNGITHDLVDVRLFDGTAQTINVDWLEKKNCRGDAWRRLPAIDQLRLLEKKRRELMRTITVKE